MIFSKHSVCVWACLFWVTSMVSAKTLQCPVPFWDDASVLFDQGEQVFGNDQPFDALFQITTLGEDVTVTKSSQDIEQTGKAIHLNLHFPGKSPAQQAHLRLLPDSQPLIYDLSHGVGMWVKAESYTYVTLQFEDAQGQRFKMPVHRQKADQWEYVGTTLNSVLQFEGKGATVPQLPVKWTGMIIHAGNRGFSRDFQVTLRGFEQLSKPIDALAQKLNIDLHEPPLGQVYRPGQTLYATFDAPKPNSKIRWQLLDYNGDVLEQGTANNHVQIERVLEQPGYYRYVIQLIEDGKRSDCREMSFVVLQPITMPHPRLGVCCHLGRPYYNLNAFDLYPLIGVAYLRNGVPWQQVERKPGVMDANSYRKEFFRVAREKQLKGMTIFNGTARHYGKGVPRTEQEIDAFIDYCLYIANQGKGIYDRFEIWNEWTNGTGMGDDFEPTPGNYTTLLKAIMPRLRKLMPDAQFIGLGGENPYRFREEIKAMLAADAGKYVDSLSVHPYRQPFPPEIAHKSDSEPLDQTMIELLSLSRQYGGPARINVTEIGYPTFRLDWGVTDKEQAQFMVRTLAMLHSIKQVDQVYWYSLRDEDELPLPKDCPTSLDYSQHHYGIFAAETFNYAPKPAVAAMATYVQQTAGCTYGSIKRLEQGVHQLDVYDNAGQFKCMLLWTVDQAVTVNVSGQNLSVVNIDGNKHKVDGNSLTISPDVQYLYGQGIEIK